MDPNQRQRDNVEDDVADTVCRQISKILDTRREGNDRNTI